MTLRVVLVAACIGISGSCPAPAMAQDQRSFGRVNRIPRSAFSPDSGLITFSEKPTGSHKPFYLPSDCGAGKSGAMVTFGGYFVGQARARAAQCPRGASRTGCLAGKPTAPLRLSGRARAQQQRRFIMLASFRTSRHWIDLRNV